MMDSTQNKTYSVLMPVYYKENPAFLAESLQSILSQTVPSDDVLVVCDGPLTDALDHVLEQFSIDYPQILHIIRLPQHGGITTALNAGLQQCRNELVARMDSDDIAYPNRCQKQLEAFEKDPDLAICSGTVDEFIDSTDRIIAQKRLPEQQEQILSYAKSRNPFNHPCVMFKKSVILNVGAYEQFHLLEDYHLWVKLLSKGYKGYNLPDSLLYMRTGCLLYKRRGGFSYAMAQIKLFRYMHKIGFISMGQYVKNAAVRFVLSMLPGRLRGWVYQNQIRKKKV